MARIHEGTKVRIRPIEECDLEAMMRWKRESASLGGFVAPLLRGGNKERAIWAEDQLITPDYAMFAIETLDDDRVVGKVGFSKDSPVYEHMARTISVVGEPDARGHGYATEARCLLVNYLFLSTDLERIYSETDENNRAARRSLEKTGMRFEGVLRHLVHDLGAYRDMAVYAILREEWQSADLFAAYRDPFLPGGATDGS